MQANASGVEENYDSQLFLSLDLTHVETSKDSNWQETSLRIKDGIVEYSYHYGGFPDKRKKEKRYSLSRTGEKELIEYIRANRLDRNIEEIQPTEGIGIAINLRLELRIENVETSVTIAGRSNIWGGESAKKTNLLNLGFNDDIHSFLAFLKNHFGYDINLK